MNKSSCSRWGFFLGLLVLVAVCVLVVGLTYSSVRARAFNSRPLVLIHSPHNHEQVGVGERVLVHATARADNGLARLELWVDNVLIATQEAPETQPTSLVLSSDWLPTLVGNHVLIVRAVSADGVEGQAALTVEAFEVGEEEAGSYIVQEGETLESIAESHGTTPEELTDLNPGLGPGGPVPGDELILPDSEPPAEEPDVPMEGVEEAPEPEDDPPGSTGIFELLFGLGPFEIFGGEPEQVTLRLEIPSLRTWEAHDDLHCYVELAGSPPQWYPDVDNDQSTDESFAPLDHGWWNSAAHLEGVNAPIIAWPGDQPLPLTVSCVGIAAGTEAFELGRVELSIPPEDWNGVPLGVEVDGAEGHYYFVYRVTRLDSAPHGVPMYLDPTMTPPFNARLDDRRISLRWDYDPRPDEEPIDGFRVYLNGNLQWVEPPDARESGLPYEWFNPPCGTRYAFSVTAFRVGFPDGPESTPSYAFVETPAEDCTREIQIIFLTLETFDLGGDGRYENRSGDVGPAYGYYFANENQITFDGGYLGPGLDIPFGLNHNTVYDLGEMSANWAWNFSGMNSTIVDVPPGGTFQFGYHIMNRDSGRCHESDDPGCDNLICEGISFIYEDNVSGELDQLHEGTLISENERCRVTYRWGPAFGSPVGSGEAGWEPLPWLEMTDFVVDEATGQVQIHIRNTGTATWPWRDLNVELQSRDGVSLGVFTWPDFVLEVGQSTTLEHPDMRLSAPFDACVLIDPFDDVLEEFERSGALFHHPHCPAVPDLAISEARYVPSGENLGQVTVTIQNVGEGALENRSVSVRTYLPDGTPLYIGGSYPDITLDRFESTTLNFGGVTESIREQMRAGYLVTVNPEATILESNTDNNTYFVPSAMRLRLVAIDAGRPGYFDDSFFTFNASVHSGTSSEEIVNWNITPTGTTDGMVVRPRLFEEFQSDWFELMGDEFLEIVVTVHPERGRHDPLTDRILLATADLIESAHPGFSTGCELMGSTEVAAAFGVRAWVDDHGFWLLDYAVCRYTGDW